jgi:cellulose synthase/poly-beta-1,6-N-acetylglucosamine synthase-like glycosyltransferase
MTLETWLAGLALTTGSLPILALCLYPLALMALARPRRLDRGAPVGRERQGEASVVVVIAAHNEEAVIEQAILGAVGQLRSTDRCIVISDASSDRTDDIVSSVAGSDDRVIFGRQSVRTGKNGALNLALERARHLFGATSEVAVVVFSDANAVLQPGAIDVVRKWFDRNDGCLIGELVFTGSRSLVAWSEGLYWRMENHYKVAESVLGVLCFGNGALMAARLGNVRPIPPDCPNDFWTPSTILLDGGAVAFDRRAVAVEQPPEQAAVELRRKRRMATRQMTTILRLWRRLSYRLRLHLVVRKVLRWYAGLLFGISAISLSVLGLLGGHDTLMLVGGLYLALPVLAAVTGGRGGSRPRTRLGSIARRCLALNRHFWGVQLASSMGATQAILGHRAAMWRPTASASVPEG